MCVEVVGVLCAVLTEAVEVPVGVEGAVADVEGGSVTGLVDVAAVDVAVVAVVDGGAMAPLPPTLGPHADRASAPAARPANPTARPGRILITSPPVCMCADSR